MCKYFHPQASTENVQIFSSAGFSRNVQIILSAGFIGGFVDIVEKTYFLALYLTSSGSSHCGSLLTIEEQEKLVHDLYFLSHIPLLFTASLMRTAGHKMALLLLSQTYC